MTYSILPPGAAEGSTFVEYQHALRSPGDIQVKPWWAWPETDRKLRKRARLAAHVPRKPTRERR